MNMTIYQIDDAIQALVNEDGEIVDWEKLDQLQMERNRKIENVACMLKNNKAMQEAIKAEVKSLGERVNSLEAEEQRLKDYLSYALAGSKFESAKAKVSYRKSEAVEIPDEEYFIQLHKDNPGLVSRKEMWKINKMTVKEKLKYGAKIEGAILVERQNVQVK